MGAASAVLALLVLASAPRFEDVTTKVGIDDVRFGDAALVPMTGGAAWLDWDDDGHVDLLLTGDIVEPLRLFRNTGPPGFVFEDVTDAAGLTEIYGNAAVDVMTVTGAPAIVLTRQDEQSKWGASLSIYRRASPGGPFVRRPLNAPGGFVFFPTHGDLDGDGDHDLVVSLNTSCSHAPLEHDAVWRLDNDGGLLTPRIDAVWPAPGCAPVPVITDFDDTGEPVALVTNDFALEHTPTIVVRDDGVQRDLPRVYGMGIAVGDVDGDLASDYLFTSIGADVLWSKGKDITDQFGMGNAGGATARRYKWGAAFLDADNDGDLELYVTAGFLPSADFNDSLQKSSFTNDGVDIAEAAGVATETVDRTVAVADYDEDGRLDMLVGSYEGWALYRNVTETVGHFVEIRMPDAPGARALVSCGGRTWQRECTGSTAGSASQRLVHVGLGECAGPADVSIRWPWGAGQTDLSAVAVDQAISAEWDPGLVETSPEVLLTLSPWPPRIGMSSAIALELPAEGKAAVAVTSGGVIEGDWEAVTATGGTLVLLASLDGAAYGDPVSVEPVAAVDPDRSRLVVVEQFGERRVIVTPIDAVGVPTPITSADVELYRDGAAVTPTWAREGDGLSAEISGGGVLSASVRQVALTAEVDLDAAGAGLMSAAHSALFTEYETVYADGQDVLLVLLYAADAAGQPLDEPPGGELDAPGFVETPCLEVDADGHHDPELVNGWDSFPMGAFTYYTRCLRADAEPGSATIGFAGLETSITKLAAWHAVPSAAQSTLGVEEASGQLVLTPRDANNHLVGSGVAIELRADPPGSAGVVYASNGQYLIAGAPARLTAVVDGLFELHFNGGVPLEDDCPSCAAKRGPASPRAAFFALFLLLALRACRRPRVS